MNKIILLILLNLTGCFALAQNCDLDLGTKTLYKAPSAKTTPVPQGYRAVFINHVGRHGARHLTKDVKASYAYTLLAKADSLNALSADGKKLWQMVNYLQKIESGNTKFISAEGSTELEGIGQRMAENYPAVFDAHTALPVAITKEVRTKQSADAFIGGLQSKLKDLLSVKFYNDDTGLRFYDASPAYKKFEAGVDDSMKKFALARALHFDEIINAFAARMFNADLAAGLDADKKAKFIQDIFGFAGIVYSLGTEVIKAGNTPQQLDFTSLFTCEELKGLALLDAAGEDLKKGPGTDVNGIQVRIAVPLLVNLINTSDAFVTSGKPGAQLRFAHAETIAPFAALLQIAIADKATTDPLQISKLWQASKVIPLSANIQWVFYQKQGDPNYRVKVLLNEQEVYIDGLSRSNFPYYKWSDLRSLYMNKLKALHAGLSDDMVTYLNSLAP